MYNIPAWRNSLPDGAGAVGSAFGAQVYNDFYLQGYDGPCPPVGVEPYTHRYVLTVFALDEELQLPQSANFPPYAETLWYALVKATEKAASWRVPALPDFIPRRHLRKRTACCRIRWAYRLACKAAAALTPCAAICADADGVL